jgi:hypothetical protein
MASWIYSSKGLISKTQKTKIFKRLINKRWFWFKIAELWTKIFWQSSGDADLGESKTNYYSLSEGEYNWVGFVNESFYSSRSYELQVFYGAKNWACSLSIKAIVEGERRGRIAKNLVSNHPLWANNPFFVCVCIWKGRFIQITFCGEGTKMQQFGWGEVAPKWSTVE